MNTKNLMSQPLNRFNGFIMQDLVVDLVELSEEDLKQISGGGETITVTGGTTTYNKKTGALTNTGGTVVITSSYSVADNNNNYLSLSDLNSGRLLESFSAGNIP
jgi:hypothetical protein